MCMLKKYGEQMMGTDMNDTSYAPLRKFKHRVEDDMELAVDLDEQVQR